MNNESRARCITVFTRHENGETYSQIGKDLGISGGRAQQLGAKGDRILCLERRAAEKRRERESLPVENAETLGDLHLSFSTSNELIKRGITSINDLTNNTSNELSNIISADAFTELIRQLEKGGLTLREEGSVKHIPENIESMGFSHRTLRLLNINNVYNFESLIECTESELMKINTFGAKCLEEVKMKLAEYGFTLRAE